MGTFDVALKEQLETNALALPEGFNQTRFMQNALMFIRNDTVIEFCKNHTDGSQQVLSGLMRGAYLGLDFMAKEAYLVPFGNKLEYMTSYVGEIKLRKKYSVRPIRDIYANVVREGDDFSYEIVDGEQIVNHKPIPFNNGKVVGAYAVCIFSDGGKLADVMSLEELENTRKSSKSANSPAYKQFPNEMYKKTVIHRLCKTIDMDLTTEQRTTLDEEMAIETDPIERRNADVEAEANSTEFVDVDAVEVVDDQIEGQMSFEDLNNANS